MVSLLLFVGIEAKFKEKDITVVYDEIFIFYFLFIYIFCTILMVGET